MDFLQMLMDEDKKRQAQEEQQQRLAASSVVQRLDSLRSDPAQFTAFRDTFIHGSPRVRQALDSTYGKDAVDALISDSGVQTDEVLNNQVKRRSLAQLTAQNDPVVQQQMQLAEKNQMLSRMVAQNSPEMQAQILAQQQNANAISLDPAIQNQETQQEIFRLKKAVVAQNEMEKTDAASEIKKRAKLTRAEEYKPKFLAEYATMMNDLQKYDGTPESISSSYMDWASNKSNAGRAGMTPATLNENYIRAKVMPEDWVDNSGKTEDQIKELEYQAMQAIHQGGYKVGNRMVSFKDGSQESLQKYNAAKNILLNSPLVQGKSPLALFVIDKLKSDPSIPHTLEAKKVQSLGESWLKTFLKSYSENSGFPIN